jgi:methyltransferase
MDVFWVLLGLICVERVAELVVSARHAATLLRDGGVESGLSHFPVMVALHVALLVGCVVEPVVAHRAFLPALGYPMLVVVVAANALRWWCIATLGERWSARVIVLPGAPLVRSGPYRWFAHPNYVAVIVEGAALPLVGSAWITAACFTIANAVLLTVRIRCEVRALAAAALGASVAMSATVPPAPPAAPDAT